MPETEEKPRRRVGRPPKDPEKGRRQNYTFRLSDQTRDQIIEAAAESGRSMSEEIEWRIEESFRAKEFDLLARSLLNGSPNLYKIVSRISGLIGAIEDYKDKSGNFLGSKDWESHEPTRAAIRAGVTDIVHDFTAPVREFDVESIRAHQNEIAERMKATNKISDDDRNSLEEYYEFDTITHMILLGRMFAGTLSGRLSPEDIRSVLDRKS